ncbi:MAG TPA: phosphoglycerate mutase, partial [Pirellulales bacterium]
EEIDRHIVTPLRAALQGYGEFRLMVSPDHPTPLRTKTHSHGAVPFAICGRGVTPDSSTSYCEPTASRSQTSFDEGWKLMRFFLGRG